MSADAKRPVALPAAEAPPRAVSHQLSRAVRLAHGGARQAAARRPVRADEFRRQHHPSCPGGWSALRHAHTKQDEFIYILEGSPTLVTDAGRTALRPGMCAGFKAGSGDSHCLVNESGADVVYLEIGDRTAGDAVEYPDDDLAAVTIDGQRRMAHKDGAPY